MVEDPETRRQLAKQGRLWLLSLICATIATAMIVRTGSLATGIVVLQACVAGLGTALWMYERRRRR